VSGRLGSSGVGGGKNGHDVEKGMGMEAPPGAESFRGKEQKRDRPSERRMG
jgi:hypothetical protein